MTETNLLWQIYESIKTLEIRTSVVFNLPFLSNDILSCFFFFFIIIDFYFLISAVTAQICIATAELVIITGTQSNEANAEIGMHPVTFETK